jgi:signal transduction histidine kinase
MPDVGAAVGPRRSPVRASMQRALAAYRIASCAFCGYVVLRYSGSDARPGLAVVAAVLIAAWTVVGVLADVRGLLPRRPFLIADVAVVAALTLLTIAVQTESQLHGGRLTLTSVWAASPVLGAAIAGGWPAGLGAAVIQSATSVVVRAGYDGRTVFNIVVLLLAGSCVGYVSQLVVRAERELALATEARAALAERERLGRSIHDGVLQVLALVQRRGAELGGDAAELGRLAGEQEAALRALVSSARSPAGPVGTADLAAALTARRTTTVTVSVPGVPVLVPSAVAAELTAAVDAALDNVGKHAGAEAHAWVFLEQGVGELFVTVRDDGVGMCAGRLGQAEAEGRLGVRSSIRARVADLGGTVRIVSAPGEGTELELCIPQETP